MLDIEVAVRPLAAERDSHYEGDDFITLSIEHPAIKLRWVSVLRYTVLAFYPSHPGQLSLSSILSEMGTSNGYGYPCGRNVESEA